MHPFVRVQRLLFTQESSLSIVRSVVWDRRFVAQFAAVHNSSNERMQMKELCVTISLLHRYLGRTSFTLIVNDQHIDRVYKLRNKINNKINLNKLN